MSESANPGEAYERRIACYLNSNYSGVSALGVRRPELCIYRKVPILRTVTGRARIVDLLVVGYGTRRMMALECWFQQVKGTKDREYAHRLADAELLTSMGLPTFVVYGGEGFSPDVVAMLQASRFAVSCEPESWERPSNSSRTSNSWELDQIIAVTFGVPDMLTEGKASFLHMTVDEIPQDTDA